MNRENRSTEHKSLRILEGDLTELAKVCVAFANANGGVIHVGIEDGNSLPSPDQQIHPEQVAKLEKRIPQITRNVAVASNVREAGNGGGYIELRVLPSIQSIAATSDGRYYMRVSDENHPLMPDELPRLLDERMSYTWETQKVSRVQLDRSDDSKRRTFLESIRRSKRVSEFVKAKTDQELLEHYLFVSAGILTNLGVLWIGRREDRARLRYAPLLQCIKFDDTEQKTNKWVWDDYALNPMELIEAVWNQVPDWRESYEIPDGLFRTSVPHYDEVVVRELLANALVHRPYTQSGDIFVNLHPDRLEIHNPGLLPIGVTPRNILHTTVKRNDHLAKVFYDLGLMEREGSGYDRIYEVLLSAGKPLPAVREDYDRVSVTVLKRFVDVAVLDFVAKAEQVFPMTQKEKITLGLLAQNEAMTAIDLRERLGLLEPPDLHHWLGRLKKWKLIETQGKAKGTRYLVDRNVLRNLDFRGATSLRNIEPHRLAELICHDLRIYRRASSTEIKARIGPEIPLPQIRKQLERLVGEGRIGREGAKRWTRYYWNEEK